VEVRPRVDADLIACERLAEVVHVNDGYPVYRPGDLGAFLTEPDALAHWVAVEGGEVVGHVALHPGGSDAMMDFATEKTGTPASEFGVVARLLVSPAARRLGIGRSLLDLAEGSARQLGRRPILEVVERHASAVRLYESRGWKCLGQITVTFGRDEPINEFVFIGPGTATT
jgi:GNAT superfamily N-acetyltransferase